MNRGNLIYFYIKGYFMGSNKSFLREDAPSYASVVIGTVVFLNIFMIVVTYSYISLEWCLTKLKEWANEPNER